MGKSYEVTGTMPGTGNETITSLLMNLAIIYTSSGKFKDFIAHLDLILHILYQPKVVFIIHDNFNIDYLQDRQLNALFITYSLINTITCPTRIREISITAMGNIFLDISKHDNYAVQPLHNGLLDHEAQLLTTDIASGHFNNHQTAFQ
jgi:hypothetical protein